MARAAGMTMKKLTRNLSDSLQPCVCVAAMVVSLMNERLSPKNEPPTTTAVSMGTEAPVWSATPAAMGVRATMVPTDVPMLSDMKQAARKSPAMSIWGGSRASVRSTVASMAPMALAELAKAPASTKIQIMSIIWGVEAPFEKVSMRCLSGRPPLTTTA